MRTSTAARVSALPSTKQSIFWARYNSEKKNLSIAIVLALLLGGIGIHEFYLGNNGGGIAALLFCWTLIPAFIALIQCFLMPGRVKQMNEKLASNILSTLQTDNKENPLERIGNADTINTELAKVNALRAAGSINNDEYEALRKKALGL